MSDVRETQLLVIGGGPGGYPAALHAADHGLKVILVDEDAQLGGVCLNRGCIPSKALLHTAKIIREAHEMAEYGVSFGDPKIDLDKLRAFVQTKVVGRLTTGIASLTKGRGVETVRGRAVFTDEFTVEVTGEQPGKIKFSNAIIATGSLPVIPKPWQINDPRVMDSTGALLLPDIPKTLLVIGGGYIGLEIGSVYAALGTKVTVVEALETILAMADRDLVKPLEAKLRAEFAAIYTNTKVASLKATPAGIVATLEGKDVPGESLSEKGARQLKSLTGGDLVEGEVKYKQDRPQMQGNFHVVIVSNNHLRIALDGDEGAWERRLVVVTFNRKRPQRAIAEFAEILATEEGPGILNWLIAGALRYYAELETSGRINHHQPTRAH